MNIEEEVISISYENRNMYGAVFELTTVCNWKCKHCYIPKHVNKGLDKEEIYSIFTQLREMGVFELTLTGGEIFTRHDIIEIIETARKMGFKVILFTNVSLLTETDIYKLSKMYVSEISCTIFSLKPEIHDFITGTEMSLKKALDNIMLIKKYNIPLTIKNIITNINFDDWKDIEKFCDKNGFGFKVDHDIFAKNDGDKTPINLRMTRSQLELELMGLDKFKPLLLHEHELDEYVCNGIQNTIFINSYGKVYPCNKFLLEIGDLKKEGLKEIWEKSSVLHRLQDMKWKDLHQCIKCENSRYCMHCPGTALLEEGDEYGKSQLACEKAEVRSQLYGEKLA